MQGQKSFGDMSVSHRARHGSTCGQWKGKGGWNVQSESLVYGNSGHITCYLGKAPLQGENKADTQREAENRGEKNVLVAFMTWVRLFPKPAHVPALPTSGHSALSWNPRVNKSSILFELLWVDIFAARALTCRLQAAANTTAPEPMLELERWTFLPGATARKGQGHANRSSPCVVSTFTVERPKGFKSQEKGTSDYLQKLSKISPRSENVLNFRDWVVQVVNTAMMSVLGHYFPSFGWLQGNSWQ